MPHAHSLRRIAPAAPLLCILMLAPAAAQDLPRDSIVDLACELIWEIPGETADYLFGGLLVGAGWDHDGNLCVVDYKNRNLKIFDGEGRWLRTLGREGEGPGELRDARGLVLADDGRVGLLQIFPAAVVWLMPDGAPAGRQKYQQAPDDARGYVAMPHLVQHDRGIMAYTTAMALADGEISERHWIVPVHLDGTFGEPVFRQTVDQPRRDRDGRLDEADYYDLWAARWAPDGQGGAWVATDRDRYRIEHHDAGANLVGVLERDYEPLRRDELGRRLTLEHMERKRVPATEVVLRDTAPVVRSLRLADSGHLWVDLDLGGRGPAAGTIAWIDVHDGAERWLGQLRLTGPYDPATDQWRFVDDRHLLVLSQDELAEPALKLLRIPETGH
jgi:hypothetical protein